MKLRIVFFGSPEFAVPALEAVAAAHDVTLVITQTDKPAGRGKRLSAPAVKEAAARLGLPVEQPATLKGPEILARLAAVGADAFVVVAYGRILPQGLLDLPRLGPWNVHASLLPKLRGAAPIQWAIVRGEEKTGVCIMRMEAGLDTGPVAARAEMPIAEEDTAGTLAPRLARLGAELLVATLPRIATGDVSLEPQDHARATLAPLLTKEDGRLSFTRPARVVSAHARGVDPWPGAWSVLPGGEPIKLYGPRVCDEGGRPGEVLGLGRDGLVVACADRAVAFAELQLAGRKRLPAAAVLAGHALPVGTLLGGAV